VGSMGKIHHKTMQKFTAIIHKVGINPCVDIPETVSKSFGKQSYVPVEGIFNGFPIRATLVPAGKGRHRLYINGEMRKQAGVGVGDQIQLVLSLDTAPRVVPMPAELKKALDENKEAKLAFDKLPPSHRREILTYLNFIKKPETLKRNIEKTISHLLAPIGRKD